MVWSTCCIGYRHFRQLVLSKQKGQRSLVCQRRVDPLCIVKQEKVRQAVKELLRQADGIFMNLDELFREGALIAFDTAVDARATRITPMMRDLLMAKIGIKFTFELRP